MTRKRICNRCISIMILVSLIFYLAGMVAAEEIIVTQGSGSIQSAIDRSKSGDIVKINPGTYRETVKLKSGLRLRGAGREQVKIEYPDGNPIRAKNVKNVEIQGVSIVSGGRKPFAAVILERVDGITFKGCRVTGSFLSGIELKHSANIAIEDCIISGNTQTGILVNDSKDIRIIKNQIEENNLQGIVLEGSTGIVISGNKILQNKAAGIFVYKDSTVTINENLIRGNRLSGVEIQNSEGEVVNNTIIENRMTAVRFSENARGRTANNIIAYNDFGIAIDRKSRVTIEYNNVYQNTVYNYARTEARVQETFPINEDPSLKARTDLSVDPYFVNTKQGDYSLYFDSPLANRGSKGSHIGAFAPRLDTGSIVDKEITTEQIPGKEDKNSFAIIIGISQYREKGITKIKYASHDAEIMSMYLKKARGVPPENIKMLLDENATKSDLEAYIEDWLPKRAKKDSTIFVYYAGHGTPNLKTQEAFLVPYDGHPDFTSKLFPLKRLYAGLNTLEAKEVVVMLDSCFSGAGGRSVIQEGARPMVIVNENPCVKCMVLAAATGSQISSDYDKVQHGLFTYFLLKGMRGEADLTDTDQNGEVSLGELSRYVAQQVSEVAARDLNREQTPVLQPSIEQLQNRAAFPFVYLRGNR